MVVEEPWLSPLVDIHRMAAKTQDMLHRALQAFVRRDLATAQAIPAEDDEVDTLCNQICRDSLTLMRGDSGRESSSRGLVNQARYVTRIARNLERAADQVVHICEWVVFTVTGKAVEMDKGRIPASAQYPTHPCQVLEGDNGKSSWVR